MPKAMQKIILFIEPNDDACMTPVKIGHLFMNLVSVDEDASFEILNVFELSKTSLKMSRTPPDRFSEYARFEYDRKFKGMGLDIIKFILL